LLNMWKFDNYLSSLV